MKRFLILILALFMLFALFGCGKCKHQFDEGSCEVPPTCIKCGATETEAPGHKWVQTHWQSAPVCAVCGETDPSFTVPTLSDLGLNASAQADTEIAVVLKSFAGAKDETVAALTFEAGETTGAVRTGFVERSVRVDTLIFDAGEDAENYGVGVLIEDANRLDLWDESVKDSDGSYVGTVVHNGAEVEIQCYVKSDVYADDDGTHIVYDVTCIMPRDYDGIIVGVYDVSHIVRLGKLWDDNMALSDLVRNGVIDAQTAFFRLR